MPIGHNWRHAIAAAAFAAVFGVVGIVADGYRDAILPNHTRIRAPAVPFAPLWNTALSDPDNPTKRFRVDFARVEHDVPLTRAHRMLLTPESIKSLSQEEVDQIYGRLTAGPIPDGIYRGDLFFARSDPERDRSGKIIRRQGDKLQTRLGEILGGVRGRVVEADLAKLELVGRLLWKGKVFYRDRMELRNQIENLDALQPLIDNRRTLSTLRVPRDGWLGRILPLNTVWLLFPAKVYCGQSLLDTRRESIIVDYAYADELAGYRERPDSLATRNGLAVRDEVRMVRPGFYLGRAYLNRMFLLNFTIVNEDAMAAGREDFEQSLRPIEESCWPGEQKS